MSAMEIFENEARDNYNKVVLHKKLCIPLTGKASKIVNRSVGEAGDPIPNSPNLTLWRERQEAERERIRKLDHTPQPPERPPKKMHLRPPGPPSPPPTTSSTPSFSEEMSGIISAGSVQGKINLFAPKPFVPPPQTEQRVPTFLTTVNKHISKFQSSSSFQNLVKPSSIKPFSVSASSLKPSSVLSAANNQQAKSNGLHKKKPAVAPKPVFCHNSSSELLQRVEPVVTMGLVHEDSSTVHGRSLEVSSGTVTSSEASSVHMRSSEASSVYCRSAEGTAMPEISSEAFEMPVRSSEPSVEKDYPADNCAEPDRSLETSTIVSPSEPADRLEETTGNLLQHNQTEASIENVEKNITDTNDEKKENKRDPDLSSDLADHLEQTEELDRRGAETPPSFPSQEIEELKERRRELVERMETKLSLLRSDKAEILVEIEENSQQGKLVASALSEAGGSMSEVDKLRVHITEVERLATLLAVLESRRERNDKVLGKCNDPIQKEFLLKKKDRLLSQLGEAKELKEFRDRRGELIKKMLHSMLRKELVDSFSDFLEKKVTLINELKQLEERIQMGEEQITALSGPVL